MSYQCLTSVEHSACCLTDAVENMSDQAARQASAGRSAGSSLQGMMVQSPMTPHCMTSLEPAQTRNSCNAWSSQDRKGAAVGYSPNCFCFARSITRVGLWVSWQQVDPLLRHAAVLVPPWTADVQSGA